MRILTLDDVAYELNEIPDEVDDMRFAVLDNSDPRNPDYFYIPLIFLESFNSPALVLRIGDAQIKMPVDWHVLIGEPDVGDLEVVPLTSINDRGFEAFLFNPLTSYKFDFGEIKITNFDIQEFKEKPYKFSFVNTGIYCVNFDAIKLLKKNEHIDMPQIIKKLMKKKYKVRAYPIQEDWHDIGNAEIYKSFSKNI